MVFFLFVFVFFHVSVVFAFLFVFVVSLLSFSLLGFVFVVSVVLFPDYDKEGGGPCNSGVFWVGLVQDQFWSGCSASLCWSCEI